MALQQQQTQQQTQAANEEECTGCGRSHKGGLKACTSWFRKDGSPNPKFKHIHNGMDSTTFWMSPLGISIKQRADNKKGKATTKEIDLETYAAALAAKLRMQQQAHAATSSAQAVPAATAASQMTAVASTPTSTDVQMTEAATIQV